MVFKATVVGIFNHMRSQESIIGNSPALASALDKVSQLARINRPVLIVGERGTGKELAAQRLHYLSPRWDAPLLTVNCAAMAESLLESELFGHEPGAFTGATRTQLGRFERADGGTLFLDELGTMSLRVQEKLLRLVEYGEFERLGGQETLQVDVRIVAATNVDLRKAVVEKCFRADLLDRLTFDVVHVPPLRHRIEDIAELAQHFAIGFCSELGWNLFAGFTDNAMLALQTHTWPGNIRELKNAVERSLFHWGEPDKLLDEVIVDPFISPYNALEESLFNAAADSAQDPTDELQPSNSDSPESKTSAQVEDFPTQIQSLEKQLTREALAANGFNQRRAALAMGLSYDQLRGLVRKYKLNTGRKAAS